MSTTRLHGSGASLQPRKVVIRHFTWLAAVIAVALVLPATTSARRKTEKRETFAIIRLQTIPGNCSVRVADKSINQLTEEGKWLEVRCAPGIQHIIMSSDSAAVTFDIIAKPDTTITAVANLRTGRVYAAAARDQTDSIPCQYVPFYNSSVYSVTVPDSAALAAPSESLPAVGEFVAVEVQPEMIKEVKPPYPTRAKLWGIEGTVWVMVLVDKTGNVRSVRIAKTSGVHDLDSVSVAAAWLCKYRPGIQKGRPVACWVTYPVKFNMASGRNDLYSSELTALVRLQTIPGGCLVYANEMDLKKRTVQSKWLEIQCYPGTQHLAIIHDSDLLYFDIKASRHDTTLVLANFDSGKVVAGASHAKTESVACHLTRDRLEAIYGVPPCSLADSSLYNSADNSDSASISDSTSVETGPRLTDESRPDYPESAKLSGVTGTVWIKALVDTAGAVRCVRIDRSSGSDLLDVASAKAAYRNRYKPATHNGRPVAMWLSYPVKFNLKGK